MTGRLGRLFKPGLVRRLAIVNIVALFPLAVLALVQTKTLVHEIDDNMAQAAMGRTVQAAQTEIAVINMAQVTARTLAAMMPDHLNDPDACRRMMAAAARTSQKFDLVGYLPLSGQMSCAMDGVPRDLSSQPQAMALSTMIEPRIFLDTTRQERGSALLVASHPVYGPDGLAAGNVIVSLPHSTMLLPEAPTPYRLAERPLALITFDRAGNILTSSLGVEAPVQPLPRGYPLTALARHGQQAFSGISLAGLPRVFSVVPITEDLFLIGAWAQDERTRPVNPLVGPYVLAGLMWLSGLLAAVFAAERLVIRHVRDLSRSMSAFARGQRGLTVPALRDPPEEIATLAEDYGRMIETILHEEAELENLLREKAHLLREVHHRTGNSLQLLASILRMHRREQPNPELRQILDHLHARIMGLSTVHMGLYHLSGGTDIAMEPLLSEVIDRIDTLHGRPERLERITTELTPLSLGSHQAVPLALLLAEVLTVFIESDETGDGAPVLVRLDTAPGNVVRLELIGDPAAQARLGGVGNGPPAAIAARLIRGFVRQLDGEMTQEERGDQLHLGIRFVKRDPLGAADPTGAVEEKQPDAGA